MTQITDMIAKDIVDAWARIRKIDNSIPDDVLDFMKDSAIEKLKQPRNLPMGFTVWRNARALEYVGFLNWWKKRVVGINEINNTNE